MTNYKVRDIDKLKIIVATDAPFIRKFCELDNKRRFDAPPTFLDFLDKIREVKYDGAFIILPGVIGKVWIPEYSQGHPLAPLAIEDYSGENRDFRLTDAMISGELGRKYHPYSISNPINHGTGIISVGIDITFENMRQIVKFHGREDQAPQYTGTVEETFDHWLEGTSIGREKNPE